MRVEISRRFFFESAAEITTDQKSAIASVRPAFPSVCISTLLYSDVPPSQALHDRMTEMVYESPLETFDSGCAAPGLHRIAVADPRPVWRAACRRWLRHAV